MGAPNAHQLTTNCADTLYVDNPCFISLWSLVPHCVHVFRRPLYFSATFVCRFMCHSILLEDAPEMKMSVNYEGESRLSGT